tara:strand:- start:31 stop:561 length:531 start_codon:yes stop_codon:yes gene_type:complete
MNLIYANKTTSAITSWSISNIPASYNHLYLVLDLHMISANATVMSVTINGETTGMYDVMGNSSSGGGSTIYAYGFGGYNKTKNNIPFHSCMNNADRAYAEIWFPFSQNTNALTTNSDFGGGGKQCIFRATSEGYGWYRQSAGYAKCYTASRISSLAVTHSGSNKIDVGSYIALHGV